MAKKPRTGGGGDSSNAPGKPSSRRAPEAKARRQAPAPPPIRDLDQLEIEEAHASGEHLTDLVLDPDDELTQWQNDPRLAPVHKVEEPDDSLSDNGEDSLELEDGGAIDIAGDAFPAAPERPEWSEEHDAPPGPPAGGMPQLPLVNPFTSSTARDQAQGSSGDTLSSDDDDPDGRPASSLVTTDDDLDLDGEDELALPRAELDPDDRATPMDLVHVSIDPDAADGVSLDEEMETDVLELTPMGGSFDELERLEAEVERLEEEDRLDEALSALRRLQNLLPDDGDLAYRYEDLQDRVIQSYFPGKDRNSVVILAVTPAELPELVKDAEAELGAILGRMDGATSLGEIDAALGDLEPGTLYRLLSRAKGKGLIRLE